MNRISRFLFAPSFLVCAFFLHLSLLLGPAPALADGSVSFEEDMMPLLHDRPDLREALEKVEFYQLGRGRRISGMISPGLAGRRVGPYLFEALHWGRPVEVRFATRTRFYDRDGNLIGEDEGEDGGEGAGLDLELAVDLKEEITDVTITPL